MILKTENVYLDLSRYDHVAISTTEISKKVILKCYNSYTTLTIYDEAIVEKFRQLKQESFVCDWIN